MKTILITGAGGFIGRNLAARLRNRADVALIEHHHDAPAAELDAAAARGDVVVHLAGVNRPTEEREFAEGNLELTRSLCRSLEASGRASPLAAAGT